MRRRETSPDIHDQPHYKQKYVWKHSVLYHVAKTLPVLNRYLVINEWVRIGNITLVNRWFKRSAPAFIRLGCLRTASKELAGNLTELVSTCTTDRRWGSLTPQSKRKGESTMLRTFLGTSSQQIRMRLRPFRVITCISKVMAVTGHVVKPTQLLPLTVKTKQCRRNVRKQRNVLFL